MIQDLAIVATIRKWGSSLGIVLPAELVKEQHLREDDQILFDVIHPIDLSTFYGKLRRRNR
ncbi:MAG: AbrB/MazE/SpoVT family DNA-binding domain-containing protein [DPANN group archaeon]|nr:AbrB/MazE/SpoVT family DNA-binding domain-containing protein [DPANN group archaeon]